MVSASSVTGDYFEQTTPAEYVRTTCIVPSGLSDTQLAEALELSLDEFQGFIYGRDRFTVDFILRLSSFFNLDASELALHKFNYETGLTYKEKTAQLYFRILKNAEALNNQVVIKGDNA